MKLLAISKQKLYLCNVIKKEFKNKLKRPALDITVKSITMRNEFYECEKHTSYWRKKAIDAMPWASKVVAVVGGYIGFESCDDYELWCNQK